MRRATATALLLAVGVAAYLFWFSDERQIRRLLDGVAEIVSQEDVGGGVAALAEIAGLTSYLAPQVIIDPGPPFQAISGAQDVVSTVGRLRAVMPVVHLELADPKVVVTGRSAAVHVAATLTTRTRDGAESLYTRAVIVSLEKRDGHWVITAARSISESDPLKE